MDLTWVSIGISLLVLISVYVFLAVQSSTSLDVLLVTLEFTEFFFFSEQCRGTLSLMCVCMFP